MPNQLRIKNSLVRLVLGDITKLEVDAFVYCARHDLALGSGFGGAIAIRGGPVIAEELKRFGPVETTDAVITSAGNLKANFIIHACGPRFQEEYLEQKLLATIRNALALADSKNMHSVAFPPLGTGFYAIPLNVCSRNMFAAIEDYLGGETGIREVVICLNDSREYEPFQDRLNDLHRKIEVTS
jgi:O-acetyl-ADP-ribose deacetylase (regulator of RNase III)